MEQKNKTIIILNVSLILLLAIAGAAALSDVYVRQEMLQEVKDSRIPQILTQNFTLPAGNVGETDSFNKSNALVVTSYTPNATFTIAYANIDELTAAYTLLNLTLIYPTGNPSPYALTLTSDPIQVTLPTPGTYAYNYRIDYLPSKAGTNTLLLDINGQK